MASSKTINVEEIRKEVWDAMRAENVSITNDKKRKDIDDLISGCVAKVDTITKSLAGLREDAPVAEVEKLLKSHITDDNMKAIKEAFQTETFTMNIEKSGDIHVARLLRDGEMFQEDLFLTSTQNISQARDQQIASLILEIVFLLLGVIGISVPLSQSQTKRIIDEILSMIRAGSIQAYIQQLIESWSSGDTREQAIAIYQFITDVYKLGLLRNILDIVLVDMSTWERIRIIAEVIAQVAIALGTEGIALISEILIALNNTVRIGEKILNLSTSNELHDKLS